MGRVKDYLRYLHTPFWWMVCVVVACVACCTSCKTKYVGVPEYHYIAMKTKGSAKSFHLDYSRWMSMFRQRDSTVTSVRTTITRNERGDTTGRETERATEHWHSEQSVIAHYKHIADSLRRELESRSVRVDSIRVPYPVEKKLSKWQQFKMDYGNVSMGGTVVAIVFIIIWLVKRFRIR